MDIVQLCIIENKNNKSLVTLPDELVEDMGGLRKVFIRIVIQLTHAPEEKKS